MNLIPKPRIDDGIMLAGICHALMHSFAPIHTVVQQSVEVALIDQRALLVAEPIAAQLTGQNGGRTYLRKALKHHTDLGRFLRVHHQFAVDDVVAEGHVSAHPHALHTRSLHLVADALSRHLALKLGEAEQDVQRQPPHRRRRVERLGDRDEGHAVAIEHLDQFGKVHERAR
mgnify:CR=1 FL=1